MTAHLARALRVASRLGDVQRRAVVAESTLDQLETPVLLLEEETGRLLLANAAARRLMQAEPVLAFRGDRVAPGVLSDSATWRAACRAGGCVLRAASGAPMALSLIPVPPSSTLARSWPRPLVLMSLPSNKSAAARARRLRQLYGLTQAEAEVAVMLACEELTPAECADRRGVSVGTIRAQIKMLQMKMDVSRLAQIVSLALMV